MDVGQQELWERWTDLTWIRGGGEFYRLAGVAEESAVRNSDHQETVLGQRIEMAQGHWSQGTI